MNLYLISQSTNNDYDTYDAAIVAAETEDDARRIHPGNYPDPVPDGDNIRDANYGTWTSIGNVKVQLVGEAVTGMMKGVVLASFNAG